MVGELRPRCRVCGRSSKGCGGGCADDQQTDQVEHNKRRKRHISVELDKKLEEEIEVIKKKIKTVKEKRLQSVKVVSKKPEICEERGPRVPNPIQGHRSGVYQRFQEMMDQKMNDQNKVKLDHRSSQNPSPRKHPYNLRSGFWIQEAKTPVPPLSFLSTLNTSEPKFTSKCVSQDRCCHLNRKDETNTTDSSQGFMYRVDQLLKKARLDTSKVSNLKF